MKACSQPSSARTVREAGGHVVLVERDEVVGEPAGGRVLEGHGPADARHGGHRLEVGQPEVVLAVAGLDGLAELRAGRRLGLGSGGEVAEVVLVVDHAGVLEAEAAGQLGVDRDRRPRPCPRWPSRRASRSGRWSA